MKFMPNDVVRLRTDRRFDNEFFQAGTIGVVVAQINLGDSYLVLLGHDTTTRILPESAIEAAGLSANLASTRRSRNSRTRLSVATSGAWPNRLSIGSRVKLTEPRTYEDRHYPVGSLGSIVAILELFQAYMVDFDIDSTDRLVSEQVLDAE